MSELVQKRCYDNSLERIEDYPTSKVYHESLKNEFSFPIKSSVKSKPGLFHVEARRVFYDNSFFLVNNLLKKVEASSEVVVDSLELTNFLYTKAKNSIQSFDPWGLAGSIVYLSFKQHEPLYTLNKFKQDTGLRINNTLKSLKKKGLMTLLQDYESSLKNL